MTPLVIVDHTGRTTHEERMKVAAAMQRQIREQFGLTYPKGYGVSALVRAATEDTPAQEWEWPIGLFSHPDEPGDLGYHGKFFAKVFPLLSPETPWSSIASHEALELIRNFACNAIVQNYLGDFMADEPCDAVERDLYQIDGIWLSNFVLPAWYEEPKPNARYDWLGLCKQPLEVRDGGYSQTWDQDRGWTMATKGELSSYRKAILDLGISRHHSRSAKYHAPEKIVIVDEPPPLPPPPVPSQT